KKRSSGGRKSPSGTSDAVPKKVPRRNPAANTRSEPNGQYREASPVQRTKLASLPSQSAAHVSDEASRYARRGSRTSSVRSSAQTAPTVFRHRTRWTSAMSSGRESSNAVQKIAGVASVGPRSL